jgi:hypothetical protein
MIRPCRLAALFALSAILSGCGLVPEVDPVVDEELLHGVYRYPSCPDLYFGDGFLKSDGFSVPVRYERQKQSNRLVADSSIRWREKNGRCDLVTMEGGTFIQFVFHERTAYMKLSSADRERYRLFGKSGNLP